MNQEDSVERDRHRQEAMVWQQEAWKLRIQGWTQQRIADHLGVSQVRVSQILQKAEKRLHAEFVTQAEEVKARQTAQLEQVYDEAIRQWRRSCEDAERKTTVTGRTKTLGEGEVKLPPLVTKTVEGQSGNAALLAQAMKALADIRAIWGLEAAKKQEVSGPEGGPIRISELVVELPKAELG